MTFLVGLPDLANKNTGHPLIDSGELTNNSLIEECPVQYLGNTLLKEKFNGNTVLFCSPTSQLTGASQKHLADATEVPPTPAFPNLQPHHLQISCCILFTK